MHIKSIVLYLYQTNNLKQIIMKLTKEQKQLFDTLVRLGDSKGLALKTVLNQQNKESEIYYNAYNL